MLKTTLNISCGTIEHCEWASQNECPNDSFKNTLQKKKKGKIQLFAHYSFYSTDIMDSNPAYRNGCVWYLWYVILDPFDTGYYIYVSDIGCKLTMQLFSFIIIIISFALISFLIQPHNRNIQHSAFSTSRWISFHREQCHTREQSASIWMHALRFDLQHFAKANMYSAGLGFDIGLFYS